MIVSNGPFIGYIPNQTTNFCGGDAEQTYLRNLPLQRRDWYYRSADISYVHNSLGHRCKNYKDIDLENYILFTGCSHTEGIGLELEKTFPYLVSKKMDLDYYNLAIGGSGIDIMTHNLITWLSVTRVFPKALVILWPEETRFCLKNDDRWDRFTSSTPADRKIKEFMVLGHEIGYFNTKKALSEQLINTCYFNSKIINLSVADLSRIDLARDLAHAGILSNEKLANKIVNILR